MIKLLAFLRDPFFKKIAILGVVVLVVLIFVQLFAQTSFNYDSLSFSLRIAFHPNGGTKIIIPPVGQLFLKTHLTPWQFVFTLDEINFAKLESQLKSIPPQNEWLNLFQLEIQRTLLTLFALIFICALTGTLIILTAFRIHPPDLLFRQGFILSLSLILVFFGMTAITYDKSALEHPQYQGALESAPWLLSLIDMGLDNIEVLSDGIRQVSASIPRLYQQAANLNNIGSLQPDLTVLHVSDIHNNPAAFDFINQLVTNFQVDFIIDTGDLTDYGTALEADLISEIAKIKIPYIFIPGNHDSPLILDRLKRLKNVKIITDSTLKVSGITITGISDPAAASYNSDIADTTSLNEQAAKLATRIDELEQIPNLVAVHNLKMATPIIGKVPLIIHGHDHKYNLTTSESTVINDAGTTGAAGIRGLTAKGADYSAAIIYWQKNDTSALKLKAIDAIKINGTEGKLTVERFAF